MMLETLKMVHGAVAEKDLVPVLTHFHIYDGRIQGGNSRMAIDAPVPELAGVSITVPADRLIKAIDLCDGEPRFDIEQGCVYVRQGKFSVRLPLAEQDSFPRSDPDPPDWEPESQLLDVLRVLRPFVSTDARNAWSLGVWIEDEYAYATNNIVLLRVHCDFLAGTERRINLPAFAIDEILRIGEEPATFGVSEGSVTFHYGGGQWIKTQLFAAEWPGDTVAQLFAGQNYKKLPLLTDELKQAITKVRPFCGDSKFPVIVFNDDRVETEGGEHGASVEGFKFEQRVRYNANMLSLVFEHATHFQPAAKHNLFRIGSAEGIFMPLI